MSGMITLVTDVKDQFHWRSMITVNLQHIHWFFCMDLVLFLFRLRKDQKVQTFSGSRKHNF